MHATLIAAGLIMATVSAEAETLRGLVVGEANEPIGGALVVLVNWDRQQIAEQTRSTRTDADGRFSFQHWRSEGQRWSLLAYQRGFAIGGVRVHERFNPLGMSFDYSSGEEKIRLSRTKPISIKVEFPSGNDFDGDVSFSLFHFSRIRPAADAGSWVAEFSAPVPKVLSDELGLRLDGDRSVKLDFLPENEKSSFVLQITAPHLGMQITRHVNIDSDHVIRLSDVGSLSGRVMAPDDTAGRKWAIEVTTAAERSPASVDPPSAPSVIQAEGFAAVETDEAGRFTVPKIAAGKARVVVRGQVDSEWLPPVSMSTSVVAGETAELVIELQRGILIRGQMVDADSGEPVEGVVLNTSGGRLVSNAQGEFQTYVRPGNAYLNLVHIPLPWIEPYSSNLTIEVDSTKTVCEVPPIKVKKGAPLTGIVTDESGHPVAGARIRATWEKADGQSSTIGGDSAVSRDDGRFVLQRTPGDTELAVCAASDERATTSVTMVPPERQEPVSLSLSPTAAVMIAGRVIDGAGQPLAGAQVRLSAALRVPAGQIYWQAPVQFGDDAHLTTGNDGTYRTPVKVPRHDQFAIAAAATGMLKSETPFLTPPTDGDLMRVPDIVLRHETAATGRVVDQNGSPVAGAVVWSHGLGRGPVRTQTADDGRFRLAQLHPDARLLFVEKAGYPLTGGVMPKGGGDVQLTVEPEVAKPSAPPLRVIERSRDERHKLLKALIEPILPRLSKSASDYFVLESIQRLLPYDREFAMSWLDKLRSDSDRSQVLFALGELDDGLAYAAQLKDPYRQSISFLQAAAAARDVVRKRELLAEALVVARRIERPDLQLDVLCGIAQLFHNSGDREATQKVIDEAKAIAEKLTAAESGGFAIGNFAETLALVDATAALNVIKNIKDQNEVTRRAGNIAYKLAGVQPAEAERALTLVKSEHYLSPYPVRVCYQMANVDLPRARRIADALELTSGGRFSNHKPQAYGVMAMALAKKDPETARQLLQSAFDALPRNSSSEYTFDVAALLLGYSETVDPGRSRQYFWRTLALHPGPAVNAWSPDEQQRQTHENISRLVIVLAMYGQFPELQADWMEPVFQYWSDDTQRKRYDANRQSATFAAMGLADPQKTIAWHAAFHAKVPAEELRVIPQPWMIIADVFGSDGKNLKRQMTRTVFHLWPIASEDD